MEKEKPPIADLPELVPLWLCDPELKDPEYSIELLPVDVIAAALARLGARLRAEAVFEDILLI